MIYVLHTQPDKELKICKELKRFDINAYVPRRELVINKNGLWTKVVNKLFPGYVFVDCEYSPEIYHKIKSADGVIRFLGSPAPLHPREEGPVRWLINGGDIIPMSYALIDANGNVAGYEGFLQGYEDNIVYCNKRQRKAAVEVKFGGKPHRANLGIELKQKSGISGQG